MKKHTYLGLLLAAFIGSPSFARAQEGGETSPSPGDARPSRVQIKLVGGVMMPSEFTPKIVYPTFTKAGAVVRLDLTVALVRHLELGGYFSFSDHPISGVKGWDQPVSGSLDLVSGGAVLKVRFDLSPWATLRFGPTVGVDYIAFPLQSSSGHLKEMAGAGLQVGLNADFRAQVARHFALVAEVGFLAQPLGMAKFPENTDRAGETVGFAFAPAVFIAAGPELLF